MICLSHSEPANQNLLPLYLYHLSQLVKAKIQQCHPTWQVIAVGLATGNAGFHIENNGDGRFDDGASVFCSRMHFTAPQQSQFGVRKSP